MNSRVKLLIGVLDALDRLFDRESGAVDVAALTYATSEALPNDRHTQLLVEATNSLMEIVRSGVVGHEARDRALEVTDDLRTALAEDPELDGTHF